MIECKTMKKECQEWIFQAIKNIINPINNELSSKLGLKESTDWANKLEISYLEVKNTVNESLRTSNEALRIGKENTESISKITQKINDMHEMQSIVITKLDNIGVYDEENKKEYTQRITDIEKKIDKWDSRFFGIFIAFIFSVLVPIGLAVLKKMGVL